LTIVVFAFAIQTLSFHHLIWSPRQGMSDLAAPLLAVLQDEADAFWCFAALMERLQSNFDTDCSCVTIPVPCKPDTPALPSMSQQADVTFT